MSIFINIITLFFCLIIAVRGLLCKRLFAPNTLFGLIWSAILFAYLGKIEIYYTFSIYSSLLLLFGTFSFFLGSGLVEERLTIRSPSVETRPVLLRTRLFLILSTLTILVFLPKAVINFGLLMSGLDFNDVYLLNLQQNLDERDFFITVITSLVAGPLTFVIIPILGLELTSSKKRIWVIILALLIILLAILQSGRRSLLIYIIPGLFFIFFSSSVNLGSIKSKLKKYFILIPLIIVSISLISWLSSQRDTSLGETGYIYLGGGVAGFSYRIEQIDKWYWGTGTLHGYLVPIMIGTKYFTRSYPEWWIKLDALVEAADEIKIGPNEYMNAFTTMFYVPYIDFGPLGVLLVSFIVGIINGKFYKRMVSNPSAINKSYYTLIIVGLFGSMYTLYFTQTPYALSFIYVLLLFKKK